MAKLYDTITDDLTAFIRAQPLFFVASAPLDPHGHVNLSPKGLDCFHVLSPQQVAYLDLTGSGNETSAHLAENGRITFMFCAFAGPPRILRLYGHGQVILPQTDRWNTFAHHFPYYPGMRQFIVADITRVQTSCGFGVPLMDYVAQRDTTIHWAEAKGEDGIAAYQRDKNMTSIDGLRTPLGEHVEHEASIKS
jgi:hypothetical protein